MADSPPKLTARLRQIYRVAALGLALGMTVEEAAAHARIDEGQMGRYLRDERFQEFLTEFNSEIEKNVIERVTRRKTRALGKLQIASEEAADKVISIMKLSDRDSTSLKAAEGILRQVGIDMAKPIHKGGELENPEEEINRKDPNFLGLEAETMKELTDG